MHVGTCAHTLLHVHDEKTEKGEKTINNTLKNQKKRV